MASSYTGITAGDQAQQYNGDIYNTNTYNYALRQRYPDVSLRGEDSNKALLKAARRGQTRRVEYLIQLGADQDVVDENEMTALHHAAYGGFDDTVQLLLNFGVETDPISVSRGTPLCLAALARKEEVARTLLNARANVHAEGGWIGSPIHAACYSGCSPILLMLLEHGAEPNLLRLVRPAFLPFFQKNLSWLDTAPWILESRPISVLTWIPWTTSVSACLTMLKDHGADLSNNTYKCCEEEWPMPGYKISPPQRSSPVLHSAASRWNLSLIEALLACGAPIDELDSDGYTALMLASSRDINNVVRLLLECGAGVNLRTAGNWNALFLAMSEGNSDVAHDLIAAGANVNEQLEGGWRPLHVAAHSSPANVNALLAEGADLNALTDDGWTPLMIAARYGQLHTIKTLIALGCEVNWFSKSNTNAVLVTDGSNASEIFDSLFGAGAVVCSYSRDEDAELPRIIAVKDAVTFRSKIAIHSAICNKKSQLLRYLCEHGADIDHLDKVYGTPVMLAARLSALEELKILLSFDAKVDQQDSEGESALTLAAFEGDLEIVKMLISHGADVNQEGPYGYFALHIAARRGHRDLVQYLVCDAHADLDVPVRSDGGLTPLKYCLHFYADPSEKQDLLECLAIVKVFLEAGVIKIPVNYGAKYPDSYTALARSLRQAYSGIDLEEAQYQALDEIVRLLREAECLDDSDESDTEST